MRKIEWLLCVVIIIYAIVAIILMTKIIRVLSAPEQPKLIKIEVAK